MKPHPREKPHYVKPTPTASNAIPEARSMEAILVFDEAEGLFGRRNAEAASSVDKHFGVVVFFPKSLRSNTSIG